MLEYERHELKGMKDNRRKKEANDPKGDSELAAGIHFILLLTEER